MLRELGWKYLGKDEVEKSKEFYEKIGMIIVPRNSHDSTATLSMDFENEY